MSTDGIQQILDRSGWSDEVAAVLVALRVLAHHQAREDIQSYPDVSAGSRELAMELLLQIETVEATPVQGLAESARCNMAAELMSVLSRRLRRMIGFDRQRAQSRLEGLRRIEIPYT